MDWDAFLTLHRGLDREGPGAPDDVAWAFDLAGVPEHAHVCDAGCGSGGDIAALLQAVPKGEIVALDAMPSFVDEVRARFANDRRVVATQGDLNALPGPFDAIWCAGALYFLGLDNGPKVMAQALAPRGVLAFSEPCFFEPPSPDAVAFWEGYPTRSGEEIIAAVEAAGLEVLGTRRVSDAGWEAYFSGLDARAAALRDGTEEVVGPALAEILDAHDHEAATWRAVRDETGYLLVVARRVT